MIRANRSEPRLFRDGPETVDDWWSATSLQMPGVVVVFYALAGTRVVHGIPIESPVRQTGRIIVSMRDYTAARLSLGPLINQLRSFRGSRAAQVRYHRGSIVADFPMPSTLPSWRTVARFACKSVRDVVTSTRSRGEKIARSYRHPRKWRAAFYQILRRCFPITTRNL